MVSMNTLSTQERAAIVSALVEGNSINSTCRMTGAAKNTVLKLLAEIGDACWKYQDRTARNLMCPRFQCDEIWSFCHAKAKNIPDEKKGQFGYGDVWTFTAICGECKLIPTYLVGNRDSQFAEVFIRDLAARLTRSTYKGEGISGQPGSVYILILHVWTEGAYAIRPYGRC